MLIIFDPRLRIHFDGYMISSGCLSFKIWSLRPKQESKRKVRSDVPMLLDNMSLYSLLANVLMESLQETTKTPTEIRSSK